MPLYEFYCTDCRSKFELLTSYETSQAGMVCASCHGQHVRKLLSVFARPSRGDDSSSHGARHHHPLRGEQLRGAQWV